jgi:hypothetical protein
LGGSGGFGFSFFFGAFTITATRCGSMGFGLIVFSPPKATTCTAKVPTAPAI